MHVDATAVPGSSILAIVGTLASVALLSFLLRLYARGRLLRSRATDDWLLIVAAVSWAMLNYKSLTDHAI